MSIFDTASNSKVSQSRKGGGRVGKEESVDKKYGVEELEMGVAKKVEEEGVSK